MDAAFELNGKKYKCDTTNLRAVEAAAAKAESQGHDASVKAALWFGLEFGGIVGMTEAESIKYHRIGDVLGRRT